MINYTPTPDFYNDYICHYNHNHDPKNGQFAKGHSGSGKTATIKKKSKQKEYEIPDNKKVVEELRRTAKTKEQLKRLKSWEKYEKKHRNDPGFVGSEAYMERNKRVEDWHRKNGYSEDFINFARKDAAGLANIVDYEDYERYYEDMTGKKPKK